MNEFPKPDITNIFLTYLKNLLMKKKIDDK